LPCDSGEKRSLRHQCKYVRRRQSTGRSSTPMGIRPARCSSLAVTGDFPAMPGVAKTRFAYGAATSRAGGPLAPVRSRGRTCVCRAARRDRATPGSRPSWPAPARACHQSFAIVQRKAGDAVLLYGDETDQGPQHLPHLAEAETQLEVARPARSPAMGAFFRSQVRPDSCAHIGPVSAQVDRLPHSNPSFP
jgi:hypothetical protein